MDVICHVQTNHPSICAANLHEKLILFKGFVYAHCFTKVFNLFSVSLHSLFYQVKEENGRLGKVSSIMELLEASLLF